LWDDFGGHPPEEESMQQSEHVRLGRALLGHLDKGGTDMVDGIYENPVDDYICEKQASDERRAFFSEHPLFIGLSNLIPEPGDYLTHDYTDVPIVLTRGKDGRLNAMMNVCRHRGARVAEGCGRSEKGFLCPYHAWRYDLDGRLRSRPREDAFEDMPKDTHGLVPLPVVEKYGMIWARPTPGDGFEVDDQLGSGVADFAGYGLESYHHYETRVLEQKMNWKLAIDTFLELYHVSALHNETLEPLVHGDLTTFDPMARNLRMVGARRTIETLRDKPEDSWDILPYTVIVYVLFPNAVFVMQGDHVETWHFFPSGDGINECRMYVSLYTPEKTETASAKRHWDRNFDLLVRVVMEEDFPLVEGIQKSFHAGAQDHIVYGRNEPGLQHFPRSVREALGYAAV